MKTLNVIGCGKAGRTLARLWAERGVFRIGSVLNRSQASGAKAVEFIGAGRAAESYTRLGPADAVMIAASDEAIEGCCRSLCSAGVLRKGMTVFHLSGSLESSILSPAQEQGARIGSIHPVKSFAEPDRAAETFAGTFCAIEGDPQACEVLREAVERLDAETFPIDPAHKTLYHAGTVFVCNYLVALVEMGLRCFDEAGVPRETAVEIIHPMVAGTVENFFRLGPAAALTGPIARGEPAIVAKHAEALAHWNETAAQLYRTLGRIAADLSAEQGSATPQALAEIERFLLS